MEESAKVLRLVKSFARGLPVIISLTLVGIIMVRWVLQYVSPMYEATVKIRIEDHRGGISGSNLYKDFDFFNDYSRIAAEVEELKSTELKRGLIQKLDYDISYYRIGNIKKTEIYFHRPFKVYKDSIPKKYMDKAFEIIVLDSLNFKLVPPQFPPNDSIISGQFDSWINLSEGKLKVKMNKEVVQSGIDLKGQYQFKINSEEESLKKIKSLTINVKAIEKDVPILRISCRHPVRELSALIATALAETYLETRIKLRSAAASKTLEFIDQRMNQIQNRLVNSEQQLESYKKNKGVINTKQETETGLRKISQLELQLTNLKLKEESMREIDNYINTDGENFLDMATGFEAFGDILFVELTKQIKALSAEKLDMLSNYTPESPEIIKIDTKIQNLVFYIKESIGNARERSITQRVSVESEIEQYKKEFNGLPTRERELLILERNFNINQSNFLFLTEKRTESEIAQAASLSFNRILDYAVIPIDPISPKKGFLSILGGFIGLLSGLIIVSAYHLFYSPVLGPEDLIQIKNIDYKGKGSWNPYNKKEVSREIKKIVSDICLGEEINNIKGLCLDGFNQLKFPSVIVMIGEGFQETGKKVIVINNNHNHESPSPWKQYIEGEKKLSSCLVKSDRKDLLFLPYSPKESFEDTFFLTKSFLKRLKKIQKTADLILFESELSKETIIDSVLLNHLGVVMHVVPHAGVKIKEIEALVEKTKKLKTPRSWGIYIHEKRTIKSITKNLLEGLNIRSSMFSYLPKSPPQPLVHE